MTDAEKQIGRISAVLYASEEVIKCANKHGESRAKQVAIETAYEHIKGIVEDVSYCPWQE